jgi:L-alanine-DL-glutamate epimerase-like enolase superfamily enzyme
MRRLRDSVDVRIAGGEMTRESYEFRDLIGAGALDVVQPDAALVGGITGARRIAIIAEEHGVVFTPHTWTNGIGLVANVHLTAGIANAPFIEFPYDPPEWSPARRDFMMEKTLSIGDDGVIVLDDTPGLGFDLDEAVLEQTRIG